MSRRRILTPADIEDEEDRDNRKKKRHLAGRKEVRLTFDDDEDMVEPILSHRVKEVEAKLHGNRKTGFGGKNESLTFPPDGVSLEFGSSHGSNSKDRNEGSSDCPEDPKDQNPVLVLDQLVSEDSVMAINNIQSICRQLVLSYEDRQLHHLFDNFERNCAFRLFLYALAHGHHETWPQSTLFVDVLRKLAALMNTQIALQQRLDTETKIGDLGHSKSLNQKKPIYFLSQELHKIRNTAKIPPRHILQVSTSIQVPRRIQLYFS